MPVNLDKLDKALDKALQRETKESMVDYLYQKRYKEYLRTTKEPVTFEVFKIIRQQIEFLEDKLGPRWYFGEDYSNKNTGK